MSFTVMCVDREENPKNKLVHASGFVLTRKGQVGWTRHGI